MSQPTKQQSPWVIVVLVLIILVAGFFIFRQMKGRRQVNPYGATTPTATMQFGAPMTTY